MIPEVNNIAKRDPFKQQLVHQIQQIQNLLRELENQSSRHKRSIYWIGSAWKWIAENPDATDWEAISKVTDKIVENNNDQLKVNEALTNTTKRIIQEYNQIINQFDHESRGMLQQVMFNKLAIVKEDIKEIIRGIQLAKAKIINTNLLQKEEIRTALTELTTLPYSNEIEAMEYAEPMVVAKNSIILYVVSIPKPGEKEYNHVLIRSTVTNNRQIYLEYQELLANQDEILGINEECRILGETIACKMNQVVKLGDNHCISRLTRGLNARCDYQFNTMEIIEPLNENIIFLTNFNGKIIAKDTTKQLNGSFVVHYANETIQINNITFTNMEIKSSHILPSVLQGNITEGQTKLDLQYLHSLHLNNVEKLKKLRITQAINILTNSTTAVVVIIIVVSLIIIQRIRRTSQKTIITPAVASLPDSTNIQPIRLNF